MCVWNCGCRTVGMVMCVWNGGCRTVGLVMWVLCASEVVVVMFDRMVDKDDL